MIHSLKTWPPSFDAVLSGVKTCEVRRDDRGFNVGDTLILHEWEPSTRSFTGRSVARRVTHLVYCDHRSGIGLGPAFVAMSVVPYDGPALPAKGL